MIKKSREKLKKIIIKLKSSPPKKKLKKYVQEYGIEHTKIIGWQNRYMYLKNVSLLSIILLILKNLKWKLVILMDGKRLNLLLTITRKSNIIWEIALIKVMNFKKLK